MANSKANSSKTRTRLMAAAASLAIAGAIGFGAVTTGTAPVLAEAVRVEPQQQQQFGFADIVERVSPAVVSVRVSAKMAQVNERTPGFSFNFPGFEDLPRDHPLNRFFRDFRGDERPQADPRFGQRQRPDRARPVSQGSGFFISEDGFLVTNNHVIDGGAEFTVTTDDGAEFSATLVGTDARTDLAVLKVEDERKFTYVTFADNNQVRVGDWVVAVGNPFGLGGTVTAGIVSARGRDIGAGPYDDFLQIDAAVNRGNSGGPAFNLNGEVVGVNTAIFSPSGGNVGIAFAIPASTAKDVVNRLIQNGVIERGWLGVQIQPVTKDIADSLGLDADRGALISEAQAGGPARAAGVRAGDVVTAVDGKNVASPRELARLIGNMDPGTEVDVTLWRNGKSESVKVKLGELPDAQRQASIPTPDAQDPSVLQNFGLTVAPADDGNGLVVTAVEADGDAAERGIEVGDVIVGVNSREVKTAADLERAVGEATGAGRKAVLLQVQRENTNRFVALPVSRG